MKHVRSSHKLCLIYPALALSLLVACGPAPTAQPSPSASLAPVASPTPSPIATPQPEPSSQVSPAENPTASPSPAASPSAQPAGPSSSASPSASPSASAQPPAQPGNLRIVEQSTTSLTLQWDFGGDARSYKLYRDGVVVAEGHVTPDYYRFEGLSASHSYRLGVQAIGPDGVSEITTLTVSTPASGRSASGNFSGGGSGGSRTTSRDDDEFLVKSFSLFSGMSYDIAAAEDGSYVIVWEESETALGYDIFAQRFNSRGRAIGEKIPVNTYTNGQQTDPHIGMDAEGNFLVVWTGELPGDEVGIGARSFKADGEPQGDQFQVNSFTTGLDLNPDVALNADGDFVVVWQSQRNDFEFDVLARRYTAEGPVANDFVVHESTANTQASAAVAIDEDGTYTVVWHEFGRIDQTLDIVGRSFDDAPGTEFVISVSTSGYQSAPALAVDSDGDYLVVWGSDNNNDGAQTAILARRFAAHGSQASDEITIEAEDDTRVSYFDPAVAIDSDGDFTVAWEHYDYDTGLVDHYARPYRASLQPEAQAFKVNQHDSEGLNHPRLVYVDKDLPLMSWAEKPGPDGDHHAIYARFLLP